MLPRGDFGVASGGRKGSGLGRGVVVEGVVRERLKPRLEGLDFAFLQCAIPVRITQTRLLVSQRSAEAL